jgi:beta-1,4-mannosyltransferase
MKVWMVTGFPSKKNPYLQLLSTGLQEAGVSVSLFTGLRGLFPLLFIGKYGRPDIIHLQWHHLFFASAHLPFFPIRLALAALFYLQFFVLRWLGVRYVWTVHNITHHESHQDEWELWHCRILARRADRLIVHCPTAVAIVAEAYQVTEKKFAVVPLGNYGEWYGLAQDKKIARNLLGIQASARLFVFFGAVRPYKGIEQLIDCFTAIPDENAELLIAGMPMVKELAAELRARAAQDTRVRLHLDYVPDDMLVRYLSAADIVVLPYTDVLTSSAVNLAAALGKCCIIPRLSCMKDFPEETVLFYTHNDKDSLQAMISGALNMDTEALERTGSQAQQFVRQFSWSFVGRQTAAIYSALAESSA